ncbi:DUF1761 domain-containing protein [Yeosuana sp. MJ-SS3]|uniref:DUF1761 domain-containing protein n=1 Tax=Gilvirhabdus luticola TaxID=3079858 RepID=A0ABU3U782_9FLAO|nr:DUF1761 domain-containing protein [Yeosuana sp. MJ-SS3]MDU8886246.1 DUF1761 domain-containing protein [Yeosuana sp. MJ-SS3]
MEQINWLSLIIATLTPSIVGMIYYHPKIFGTVWMKSIGLTEEDFKKQNRVLLFTISLVMSFILSFFLTNFNNSAGQEGEFDTFGHGAFHGLVLSLFIIMPVLVTGGMYELKKFKNIAINLVYWIITLALMGGIVDVMNHWPN